MHLRCLTLHARYVCAHAGACCRAGWAIPVEASLVAPLRTIGIQIGPERLAPTDPGGQCVFFEADTGRLCRIHRLGGPSLLPSACRHFPRVVVRDPRGISVTLSHFCPTAASLLFETAPLAIVDAPASLALDGALEGLDATSVLPPLLAPGVLTDWDGYSAWEECAVALFGTPGVEPERAVDLLRRATDACCIWRPGTETLRSAVRRAFALEPTQPHDSGAWNGLGRAVNAFLAAHAFASWAAYERHGLRSVSAAVETALAVLTQEIEDRRWLIRETLIEGIRAADLQLRHRDAAARSE